MTAIYCNTWEGILAIAYQTQKGYAMRTSSVSNPPAETIKASDTTLKSWTPMAAIFCAVILWGSSFAAMGYVLQFLNPWSVMWLRMIIPLMLLLPQAGHLMKGISFRNDLSLILPMVLFQPCLYFLLEANALKLTTSSQAGVVSAFVPLMVTIGAYVTLREPLGRRSIIGISISLFGVTMLTLMQGEESHASNPYIGNTLELLAMACAAGNMLIIKKLSSRYNPWALTAMQIFGGTVFFLPGLWFLIQTPAAHFSPGLTMIIVYLGIGVTLGAFGCYNWGMSRMPAGHASAFINLVPVFAVFFGWGVMGDVLSIAQWLAVMAVIGGIWFGLKT